MSHHHFLYPRVCTDRTIPNHEPPSLLQAFSQYPVWKTKIEHYCLPWSVRGPYPWIVFLNVFLSDWPPDVMGTLSWRLTGRRTDQRCHPFSWPGLLLHFVCHKILPRRLCIFRVELLNDDYQSPINHCIQVASRFVSSSDLETARQRREQEWKETYAKLGQVSPFG